jgi:hypothetical protein
MRIDLLLLVLFASCTTKISEPPASKPAKMAASVPSTFRIDKVELGWCEEHKTPEALCTICSDDNSCEKKLFQDPNAQSCEFSPP